MLSLEVQRHSPDPRIPASSWMPGSCFDGVRYDPRVGCNTAGFGVPTCVHPEKVGLPAGKYVGLGVDSLVDVGRSSDMEHGRPVGRLAGLEALIIGSGEERRSCLVGRGARRLRVIAARVHHNRGDAAHAEKIAQIALTDAAQTNDYWAIAWMSNTLAVIRADRGDLTGAAQLLRHALADSGTDPHLTDARLLLLGNLGSLALLLERFDEAQASFVEGRQLAERAGNVRGLVRIQQCVCEMLFTTGQWDASLAEAQARLVTKDLGADLPIAVMHACAAIICHHRRDAEDARRHLSATRPFAERVRGAQAGLWLLAEALDLEVAGRPADALAILSAGLAIEVGEVDSEVWLPDAVRLAVELGDRQTAARFTARAEELAATGGLARRAGDAEYCRGLLKEDPDLLLRAADSYASARRLLSRALALEAAARLLAGRGDSVAARAPLTAAMDVYTGLGAEWDLARMRKQFRQLGVRQPRRRPRRPATGWEALTPAEAAVAELVAAGRSNPEIAKELVISRHTVETHVARVLAKLQVRSRAELARAAALRSH